MSYNPLYVEPKELISESLQDAFDSTQETKLEDQLILASLVINNDELFTGKLLGVEFGDNPKLDIKALTQKSFEFIGSNLLTKKKIYSLILTLGEAMIQVPGPFNIVNLKIIEIDYENKTCVLAIDLFKDQP
jgi:hypothetical protein